MPLTDSQKAKLMCLPQSERMLYRFVTEYCQGCCHASNLALSIKFECNLRTIQKAIANLERKGLLSRSGKSQNRTLTCPQILS